MERIKNFFKNLFFDKIKLWKLLTFLSVALFLFLLVLATSFFVNRKKEVIPGDRGLVINDKECLRRDIDGVCTSSEKTNLVLFAVMLDNHPDARPVLGLEKAVLVYEAEVEGSYTRYMAIFAPEADTGEIGAVRSARPYFVYWAKELGAVYTHCGGSPEALVDLAKEENNIIDLNEYYNGQYFWRSNFRPAPHNIITSGKSLIDFIEKKGLLSYDFIPWIFKDDVSLEGRGEDGNKIEINFKSNYFKTAWLYNRDNNNYKRLVPSGEEQLTSNGSVLQAKNIIIQTVTADVLDDKLRLKMDIIGFGDAIFCLDGKCEIGEWRKLDLNSRTKFYLNNGEEVKFNTGTTWIEIVRPNIEVTY